MAYAILLLSVVLTGMGCGGSSQEDPAQKANLKLQSDLTSASSQVMCMCKDNCNKVLVNCNCSYADQFENELLASLKAGKSIKETVDTYVARYGEIARSAPPKEGFNLTAWLTPFAGILAGGAVLALVLSRWKKQADQKDPLADQRKTASGKEENQEVYEKELDKELNDYEF